MSPHLLLCYASHQLCYIYDIEVIARQPDCCRLLCLGVSLEFLDAFENISTAAALEVPRDLGLKVVALGPRLWPGVWYSGQV